MLLTSTIMYSESETSLTPHEPCKATGAVGFVIRFVEAGYKGSSV